MRERDRRFAQALVREVGANGGVLDDAALLRAGAEVWFSGRRGGVSEARLLTKVKKKLAQPDVRDAIGDAYQLHGFDVSEAIDLHVKHMRGEIVTQKAVVVGKGPDATVEVVDVKLAPNYAALKDFEAMVLPQQPRRVDVRTQQIPGPHQLPGASGVPPMRTRSIGALPSARTLSVKPAPEAIEEGVARDAD